MGPPGSGLTHLALSLLATQNDPFAYVDVLGWLCPVAAWEAGIEPERLIVVRCGEGARWAQVVGALIDGVPMVYAEVPEGVSDKELYRLSALARARRTAVLMRPLQGGLPAGVAFTRIHAREITWDGIAAGHGQLRARQMTLEVSGKGFPPGKVELGEDGSLRLVSGLVGSERATG
ncbi:MAG: hypothetical protein ACE5MI_06130 [Acidimicrobiia bacterium]